METLPPLPRLRTLLLTIAGFFGVALLIYGWSLHDAFVRWDDGMLIYENPVIRTINIASMKWVFTHFDPELYIPLTFFTYQIDYLIGGINPFLYHLDNLILHTFNALLVMWLLFLMLRHRWIALFCGLLFLVHPLHTEAVEWASARKDVLSTFFFLSSIIAYLYYQNRPNPNPNPNPSYWVSVTLFLLGLLSKVMIITLPLVLLLIDWHREREVDRRMFTDKIPYVALSILFGLIGLLGKQGVVASSSTASKILMAGKSMAFYVHQFFWPLRLSLLYPYTKAITITSPDFFLSWIFVIALIAAALFLRNRLRTATVGILFFFVTVSPTLLNFAKGGDLDIYFASDRYAYVPSIGLIIALASLVAFVLQKRQWNRAGFVVGTLLLATLAGLAYRQSLVWADTRSLFYNVIRLYPDSSYVAHNNLGNMYRLDGDLPAAINEYKQALAIRPHAKTYSNLGAAYRKQRNYTDALDAYARALALDPQSPAAHFGLGIVYADQGRLVEAEAEYKKSITLDPTDEAVEVNLGALYAAQNRFDDAIVQYKKALAKNPYYPQAAYNLGVAESSIGNFDAAIGAYRDAISFDPTMIPARINLALLLYNQKGDRPGSGKQFRAILKLNPANASAISALRQMGGQ